MNNSKRLLALAISTALSAPAAVYATNGMNLEGYGAEALGMGGASMAYDNGTAAMMNNPATLGMMDDGGRRLDLALGFLGPDITTEFSPMAAKWESKSDAFYMPAAGYASKSGKLTWGVGAFAQGGMGTEYKAAAPGAVYTAMEAGWDGMSPPNAIQSQVLGWEEMSEVGVMRILVPLAYNVNDQLTVGGSIDYVRASMDIKMAMPGSMMMDMMPAAYNPAATNDAGELSGTMIDALAMAMNPASPSYMIDAVYGGYFDFADSNPYAGETEGDGFAGKLGFTYKVNDKLSIGGTYHSKTSLGDLTGNAEVSMAVDTAGAGPEMVMPVNGKMTIKDFQWPETWGLGVAFQATDKLFLAADVKQIKWAAVMKDFNMSFKASDSPFAGTVMDATLYQNWDDQTAFQIGGAYQATDALVVRLGANISKNPVPDSHLNYLFPAIIENHYTAGFGYAFSDVNAIDFAVSIAPEVSATSELSGLKTKHSQMSWQLGYNHRF